MISFTRFTPRLSVSGIRSRVDPGIRAEHAGQQSVYSCGKNLLFYAFARGLVVATRRERAFTDYVLPYTFGLATVVIAAYQFPDRCDSPLHPMAVGIDMVAGRAMPQAHNGQWPTTSTKTSAVGTCL